MTCILSHVVKLCKLMLNIMFLLKLMDLVFRSLADDDVEEGESVEEETEEDTEVMETSLHGSPDPLPEVSHVG